MNTKAEACGIQGIDSTYKNVAYSVCPLILVAPAMLGNPVLAYVS